MAHSLMAKGTVPDNHPLLLGMPGFWGLEVTNDYARNADLVLALGTRFAETDASSWEPAFTWRFPPSRLIQVDIDPAEIGRNYPVEIGAVADTALAVTAIADAVTSIRSVPVSRDGLRATITAARGAAFAAAREQGQGERVPAAPAADPGRPAGGPARRRGAGHRRGLEQERRRAVLRTARRGPVHHPRRRVDHGLRTGRRRRGADRLPRTGGGGPGRRRRHERAAAGHPDGGRAGAARASSW